MTESDVEYWEYQVNCLRGDVRSLLLRLTDAESELADAERELVKARFKEKAK